MAYRRARCASKKQRNSNQVGNAPSTKPAAARRPRARDEKGAAQACSPRPRPVPITPSPLRGGGECPRPPEHAAALPLGAPRFEGAANRRSIAQNCAAASRRAAAAARSRSASGGTERARGSAWGRDSGLPRRSSRRRGAIKKARSTLRWRQ